VRATAARALGRINPDPAIAAPALSQMIQSEADPVLRRAAAQGLAALMQSVTDVARERLSTQSSAKPGQLDDEKIKQELVQAGVAAVQAAGPAAADNDPEVRRLALQVFQLAAVALADLVGEATAEADQ